MSLLLNAVITEDGGMFVALNPETGVASQGRTVNAAVSNLKEAVSLYLDEADAQVTKNIGSHSSFLTTITV